MQIGRHKQKKKLKADKILNQAGKTVIKITNKRNVVLSGRLQ